MSDRAIETTAHRVIRLLEKRGVHDGMTAASVQGMVATGDRAGFRVRRVLSDPPEAVRTGDLCYVSRGFSRHVATRIRAGAKDGLERLCRYIARPPLAAGRLTALSEDELLF